MLRLGGDCRDKRFLHQTWLTFPARHSGDDFGRRAYGHPIQHIYSDPLADAAARRLHLRRMREPRLPAWRMSGAQANNSGIRSEYPSRTERANPSRRYKLLVGGNSLNHLLKESQVQCALCDTQGAEMAEILVIDDYAGDRYIITEALACAGHTIREARDGAEGVALCREQLPSLVITDIVMAGKDGIETVRELRQLAPNVPIVAVSGAQHSTVYLSLVTLLSADAVLTKPFKSDQLIVAVERLLRRQGKGIGENVRPERVAES